MCLTPFAAQNSHRNWSQKGLVQMFGFLRRWDDSSGSVFYVLICLSDGLVEYCVLQSILDHWKGLFLRYEVGISAYYHHIRKLIVRSEFF